MDMAPHATTQSVCEHEFQLPLNGITFCSDSVIHPCLDSKCRSSTIAKMPAARSVSATTGGIPDTSPTWPPEGPRGARNRSNAARTAGSQNCTAVHALANKEVRVRVGVVPEGAAETNTELEDVQTRMDGNDANKRDISSHSHVKFAVLNHCHSAVCDFINVAA